MLPDDNSACQANVSFRNVKAKNKATTELFVAAALTLKTFC